MVAFEPNNTSQRLPCGTDQSPQELFSKGFENVIHIPFLRWPSWIRS